MDKEPKEFVEARASLKKWEENFGDPEKLPYLQRGINFLSDIIMGDYAQVYKDRANHMVVAYRKIVALEVKAILSNADSYVWDFLGYWRNVMSVFTNAGLDDDLEFKASEEELFSKWGQRLLNNLSPWELEQCKKLVQQKSTRESE